jgi:polysaccharide export outer membrane protein
MRKLLLLAALLAACGGCSHLPWAGPQGGAAGDFPQPAISAYRLGPSDVIEVQVWKEPELTRAMVVRSDGKVSLPLVGEVAAAGKTTSELEAELAQGLRQFVENPVVTVIVAQANSSKFYVMGEVMRPGEYGLPRRITVLQAISTAGGFTEWANQRRLVLIRRSSGEQQQMRINYKLIVSGARPQDNCMLLPGDTIVVP